MTKTAAVLFCCQVVVASLLVDLGNTGKGKQLTRAASSRHALSSELRTELLHSGVGIDVQVWYSSGSESYLGFEN